MLHTCTTHQPGSNSCYNKHRCRCRSCIDAHSAQDRRSRLSIAAPSDTIPVTEAERDGVGRLLSSHGADDLYAMLGLDLTASPSPAEISTDGPHVHRVTTGPIHGVKVA